MSIRIYKDTCIGCGQCSRVCPGSLIRIGDDGKAYLPKPQNCWGCTSCMKECPVYAIRFYLGADIGGMGSTMHTEKRGSLLCWIIDGSDGKRTEIAVNPQESNQY